MNPPPELIEAMDLAVNWRADCERLGKVHDEIDAEVSDRLDRVGELLRAAVDGWDDGAAINLTAIVRSVADTLSVHGPEDIDADVQAIRDAGIKPGIHEGAETLTDQETAEWFAGQLLSIVDGRHWHCVNTWLNCVDKFAPPRT